MKIKKVPSVPSMTAPPQVVREDYALLSDVNESEIFELPLTIDGHLNINVVSIC